MNATYSELLAIAEKQGSRWTAITMPESGARTHINEVTHSRLTFQRDVYDTNQVVMASWIVEGSGNDIKYIPEKKAYVFWDAEKMRWCEDPAGDKSLFKRVLDWVAAVAAEKGDMAFKAAKAAALAANQLALGLPMDTDAAGAEARAQVEAKLLNKKFVSEVFYLVSKDPRLVDKLSHWDADPWVLNTPGGCIDLRTGELMDDDESKWQGCMKQTTVTPEVGETPLWDSMLDNAFPGDDATRQYFETALAMSLVGDQGVQEFYLLCGLPGTGKSTALNIVQRIMGIGDTGYSMEIEAKFLATSNIDKHPEEFARLVGRRLVTTREASGNWTFDAAKVKSITAGDTVSGRFMRGNSFNFRPSWHLYLATNERPKVTLEDEAFWRRLREIPFNHVPDRKVDKLDDKIVESEGGRVLGRLLMRLADVVEAGGFDYPLTIQHAMDENKTEQDNVAEFVRECCNSDDADSFTTNMELHKSYVAWCRDNGYTAVTSSVMGRRLTYLGVPASKRNNIRGRLIRIETNWSMY